MDIYKEKFTSLEREVLRVLFTNTGKEINQRQISKILKVSPTAISNTLKSLKNKKLVIMDKDKGSREVLTSINIENQEAANIKRVENLRAIYSSGLLDFFRINFPVQTIILFGSYSKGEDNYLSDIDIAVIGIEDKDLDVSPYERIFRKKINIQFYKSFKDIHKDLKESLANGIILQGGFEL